MNLVAEGSKEWLVLDGGQEDQGDGVSSNVENGCRWDDS